MKIRVSLLVLLIAFLSACTDNSAAATDPSGVGHYDRQAVCDNLSRQIGFLQDQGYNATNQGASQVQMQQLMARYKANGCDK